MSIYVNPIPGEVLAANTCITGDGFIMEMDHNLWNRADEIGHLSTNDGRSLRYYRTPSWDCYNVPFICFFGSSVKSCTIQDKKGFWEHGKKTIIPDDDQNQTFEFLRELETFETDIITEHFATDNKEKRNVVNYFDGVRECLAGRGTGRRITFGRVVLYTN